MTGFNGNAFHTLGQHLLLPVERLLIKARGTGHGHHPNLSALLLERLLRFERDHDFGTRRNQHRLGHAVAIREHIATARDVRGIDGIGDLRQILPR